MIRSIVAVIFLSVLTVFASGQIYVPTNPLALATDLIEKYIINKEIITITIIDRHNGHYAIGLFKVAIQFVIK